MKVRLSADALADLDEIADWIGQDDWNRAEEFVERLRAKCASLSRFARRHPVVAGMEVKGVRKLVWRDYLVFYRIGEGAVEILRILHGSRDWALLLTDGE